MEHSEPVYDESAVQALIRAYVACQVAMDSLDELPPVIRDAVREPLGIFCNIVGPEVQRISVEVADRT